METGNYETVKGSMCHAKESGLCTANTGVNKAMKVRE